jgi:hypothetical protein
VSDVALLITASALALVYVGYPFLATAVNFFLRHTPLRHHRQRPERLTPREV